MRSLIGVIASILFITISANANAYSLEECKSSADGINYALKKFGPIKSGGNATALSTYCFEDEGGIAVGHKYLLDKIPPKKQSDAQVLVMKNTMRAKINKAVCNGDFSSSMLDQIAYDFYEYYLKDQLLYSFKIRASDCK